jgi:hypothetical protein
MLRFFLGTKRSGRQISRSKRFWALDVQEAIMDGESSRWTRRAARPFNYSKSRFG